MTAYYNEFDPGAAAWLRELIKAGLIAAGEVDERSIEDVFPDDLRGFTQCHFFAGIGGWSRALRLAGWPDSRPVWTGSCPCQPFSAAGKGAAFDDERHLWPAFHHLIKQRRPAVVLGEQVASKAADDWIDLVHADLEGLGYAFGCVPFPSAGVGAPHIRDRNYWAGCRLADSSGARGEAGLSASAWRHEGFAGIADDAGREQPRAGFRSSFGGPGHGGMADMHGERCRETWNSEFSTRGTERTECNSWDSRLNPLRGFWRDADWLFCRDGKWRPVEPGTFPLAHGVPARVVRLRGYGNAINPEQAATFIEACAELIGAP
jgi:DNA (cytosine-5)-methyltransferase 1